MEIQFVNHASVILRHGKVSLMSDPWIEGKVFHNGWSLLAPSSFGYADFQTITHIWFSHEHPDHFFPPNLKKIPEQIRASIVVLFQTTDDKKVVNFCRNLGFREIIELPNGKPYQLTDDITLLNGKFGHDSWLLFKTPEASILNVNDCVISTKQSMMDIHEKTGDVDVLFTQFSYAQWEGNKDQPHLRKLAAEKKLASILLQAKCAHAKYVVPFASFVRFSHEENSYMNDGVFSIDHIGSVISQNNFIPIIMFPGDKWTPFNRYENGPSIQKYVALQSTVGNQPLTKSTTVSFAELKKQGDLFLKRCEEILPQWRILITKPLIIYLTDTKDIVLFSLTRGLKKIDADSQPHHAAISSEVLAYCFENNWGFNTTHVNGRIEFNGAEGYTQYLKYETFGNMLNHQEKEPGLVIKLFQKINSLIRTA